MLGSRQDIPRLQSDFYRDQFRKTLGWVIMSLMIILLLLSAIIYQVLVLPSQHYYANTTDGKILAMPRKT